MLSEQTGDVEIPGQKIGCKLHFKWAKTDGTPEVVKDTILKQVISFSQGLSCVLHSHTFFLYKGSM